MIAITIGPDKIRAVAGRAEAFPQGGGTLGKRSLILQQCRPQNLAVLGLCRTTMFRSAPLQGLDDLIVDVPNGKLSHISAFTDMPSLQAI